MKSPSNLHPLVESQRILSYFTSQCTFREERVRKGWPVGCLKAVLFLVQCGFLVKNHGSQFQSADHDQGFSWFFALAGVFELWNWPWRNKITPNLLWVPKLGMGRNTGTPVSFRLPWWTIHLLIYLGRKKWLTPFNSPPFMDDVMAMGANANTVLGWWLMFQHEQISEKEHLQELLGPRVLIKHGYLGKKKTFWWAVAWIIHRTIYKWRFPIAISHCHVWPPEGKGDVWNPQTRVQQLLWYPLKILK